MNEKNSRLLLKLESFFLFALQKRFLREEPDRLEHSLKRCKKLTGTLVTLKRQGVLRISKIL